MRIKDTKDIIEELIRSSMPNPEFSPTTANEQSQINEKAVDTRGFRPDQEPAGETAKTDKELEKPLGKREKNKLERLKILDQRRKLSAVFRYEARKKGRKFRGRKEELILANDEELEATVEELCTNKAFFSSLPPRDLYYDFISSFLDAKDTKLKELGVQLVAERIDEFEIRIGQDFPNVLKSCREAASPDQRSTLEEFTYNFFRERVRVKDFGYTNWGAPACREIIRTEIDNPDSDIQNKYIELLLEGYAVGTFDIWNVLDSALDGLADNRPKADVEKAEKIIQGMLRILGLTLELTAVQRLIQYWKASHRDSLFNSQISRNLSAMEAIEKEAPDTCRTLVTEFGILDFDRYPKELLIEQVRSKDRTDLPYGIILYPRNDWNGVFYQNKQVIEELGNQLKGKYLIRIIECEGKSEIARRLLEFERRYYSENRNRLISFGLIGGHGDIDGIRFGGDDEGHRITTRELSGQGISRANRFFDPKATIILNSCSTGYITGFAQNLSRQFGLKVIGPTVPTSLKSIQASEDQSGALSFIVEYNDPNVDRQYTAGRTS